MSSEARYRHFVPDENFKQGVTGSCFRRRQVSQLSTHEKLLRSGELHPGLCAVGEVIAAVLSSAINFAMLYGPRCGRWNRLELLEFRTLLRPPRSLISVLVGNGIHRTGKHARSRAVGLLFRG